VTKILIGVDASERSEDAVAFGRALALAAGAPVILATAHRSEPSLARHAADAHDAFWRADAEATLARLALPLRDVVDLELRALVGKSAAYALQETAEREGVGIIVVGSSYAGRLGRVLPGSTAERLLHGAPCPVAVVPVGYRTRGTPERPVVGCAYQPTADGEASLGAAEELALALSASLRVMHVVEPLWRLYDPGEMPLNLPEIDASIRAGAKRTLNERVARLNSRLESEGTLCTGKPADVLIGLTDAIDVLVIGCRGYGALKEMLLGGVSVRVIRSAACPVVVVPRRARSALGSVFAAAALTGTR
jgi:nucleotide-binding universal stress UspA family protein